MNRGSIIESDNWQVNHCIPVTNGQLTDHIDLKGPWTRREWRWRCLDVTLTQPHIKLHTLPVSASPSTTHFHSMRQWNRHLFQSLRTPEVEDRREKLSVDDGTHYLNHAHLLPPLPLLPFSYLSSSMHHSPSPLLASLTLTSLLSFLSLSLPHWWNLFICKETHTGQGFLEKNKTHISLQHKSAAVTAKSTSSANWDYVLIVLFA